MGFLQQFLTSPVDAALGIFALIIAIGFHEFSHVLVAYSLGDQTGKQLGRLTLNPLKHLDPLGFLLIFVIGFGYGRPAPFNPDSLRYKRFGPTLVAFGGPISNILLVALFSLLWHALYGQLGPENLLIRFIGIAIFYNAGLAIFNLIPLPPLDGSHFVTSLLGERSPIAQLYHRFGVQLLFVVIVLDAVLGWGIFNWFVGGGIELLLRVFGLG